jgi:hypothetical protein
MKFRYLPVALAIFFLTTSAALADEASKAKKIEEFFRLAKMDEMLRAVMSMSAEQMKSGFVQELTGVRVPPEKQKAVDEFIDRMNKVLMDALAWEKLQPEYVKLFAGAYSEQEVDDLIAFYRSPTGQAMVARSGPLMAKSSQIVQQKVMAAQAELQRLTREFTAQQKKQ